MKSVIVIRLVTAVASLLLIASSKADFSGVYTLTPVNADGTGGQYGAWTAAIGPVGGVVDVSGAPAELELGVPTGAIMQNDLVFQTHAAASGTVSFYALATSPGPNSVFWFTQHGSADPVYSDLALSVFPQPPGSPNFAFQVQAGDVFGFDVWSGSDLLPPNAPLMTTLTIENFSAPIPEPGTLMLLLAGLAALGTFRRSRG